MSLHACDMLACMPFESTRRLMQFNSVSINSCIVTRDVSTSANIDRSDCTRTSRSCTLQRSKVSDALISIGIDGCWSMMCVCRYESRWFDRIVYKHCVYPPMVYIYSKATMLFCIVLFRHVDHTCIDYTFISRMVHRDGKHAHVGVAESIVGRTYA